MGERDCVLWDVNKRVCICVLSQREFRNRQMARRLGRQRWTKHSDSARDEAGRDGAAADANKNKRRVRDEASGVPERT